jgi:CelD/BcsL family acetyltransferase involved in cellulose biosynthesis
VTIDVSSGRLQVEIARDPDALESIADEWNELVGRQPLPSPMLSTAWLSDYMAARAPRLVLVRRGGRLVAAGAFRITRHGPFRVATWLGGNRLPGLLGEPDGPLDAVSRVVETIRQECEVLWLTHVNPLGPTLAAVAAALPWARWTAVAPGGYVTPLPPTRLTHARSRAAYETRRANRKGARLTIEVSARPAEVGEAFDRLVGLYRSRWRDDERSGDAYSDIVTEHRRYARLLPALAAENAVRIVEVLDGDHLLASLLGLVHGSGAVFHTTATDPTPAVRGPGHLAMLGWVEEATALGASVMYLGRGGGHPEGPKLRLGATELPLVDVLAAGSRSLQRGLTAALAVRSRLRREP